jgi:hypothetical protein
MKVKLIALSNCGLVRVAFKSLCKVLHEKGRLVQTKKVTIEEAVAMFLHILAHNLKI